MQAGDPIGTPLADVLPMTDLVADVRTAIRQCRRRPVLPLAVVATLTAGLGAAIAVFAVTWAVVWRPLDVPEPRRLVWIASQSTAQDIDGSSPGAALTWQAEARTLDALAAVRSVAGAMADDAGTDRLPGALVTASIFDVLGVRPVLGRAFASSDDMPGAARVLLLSHRTWQARYAGAATVVGRGVALDGRAATIIGVLPANAASLLPDADWWAPIAFAPSERANIGPRYLDLIGRLAATATPAVAQQELAAIGARLPLVAEDGTPLGVRVTPLAEHLTARYRVGLMLLLAGVVALVLIACANVATLLLTRAHDRRAELALRASLGATRARLARQLLVEAALLASVSAAGGLLAAWWLTDLLRALLPADVPRLAEAHVDVATATFALAAGAIVTLLAGLAPALRGTRADLQSMLRIGAVGGASDEHVRRVFVVAQVALAVVLACAAALLVRSAWALDQAPRGYDTAGVLTASLTLPAATYREPADIVGVLDRIVQGASALPGVTHAAVASQLPFAGGSAGSNVALSDEAFSDGVDRQVRVRLVGPGYLRALGVPLRAGREVIATDGATSQPVVIVNETLARRLTPGASPLGRAVKFGVPVFNGVDGTRVWHVVGIAADTWDRGPREAVEPEVLIPLAQTPSDVFFWISRELQLAVRTRGDAQALAPDLRRVVAAADPAIPLGRARTLDERVIDAFARERLMARLLAALGAAGVALALLGLVAVVHNQVQRRRRDIAIRLALGATSGGVVGALVRDGAQLAGIGALAGGALSVGSGGLLASLLYGVAPGDPATLAGVAAVVVGLAVLAAWVPARGVARVDPAEALRT